MMYCVVHIYLVCIQLRIRTNKETKKTEAKIKILML